MVVPCSEMVTPTRSVDVVEQAGACEVSVIIPSYNSRGTVRACLASVLAQNTAIRYEVLVVDSSDDGTEEIIRASFPQVRLYRSPQRMTCGAARNFGIERAEGRYVLLVDTDCEVPPDWVERMVGLLRQSEADGVCGSIRNGTPWSLSGTTGYFLEFFRFLGPRGGTRPVRFLIGGNSGYRRSLFERAGFLDRNAGDDFDFSWRASQSGSVLVFDPGIAITHRNKTGLRRVLSYQYSLGKAAARYRREVSPEIVRMLALCPPLVFLLPPFVILWIGGHVLARGSTGTISRFLVTTPMLLLFHYVWAFGLASELRVHRPAGKVGTA